MSAICMSEEAAWAALREYGVEPAAREAVQRVRQSAADFASVCGAERATEIGDFLADLTVRSILVGVLAVRADQPMAPTQTQPGD